MRTMLFFGFAALAGTATAVGALAFAGDGSTALPNDTRMERLLAGKTPGPAQSCVDTRRINNTTIIDDRTILYRVSRSEIYRNTIDGGCPGLDHDRSISTRVNSTQLCEGDQIQVFDNQTGVNYGACALGAFVPYSTR